MANQKKPLLDITTLIEREFILIDGTQYSLKTAAEIALADYYRISSRAEQVREYTARAASLTAEEAQTLADALDLLLGMILIAPAEIRSRMHEMQKLSIVQAFTALQMERNQANRLEPSAANQLSETSTGETNSRD